MEGLDTLLDTLVRLASLGASGVCIFAIFWIGWLIMRLPIDASVEKHKTLRYYMGACILIAIISGGTGAANAIFNAEKVEVLKKEKSEVTAKLEESRNKISTYEIEAAKFDGILVVVENLLRQKEIEAGKTTNDTLKGQVDLLQQAIKDLKRP